MKGICGFKLKALNLLKAQIKIFLLLSMGVAPRVLAQQSQKIWATKLKSKNETFSPIFSLTASDPNSRYGDFFAVGLNDSYHITAMKMSGVTGKVIWSKSVGTGPHAPLNVEGRPPAHHGCNLAAEVMPNEAANIYFSCPAVSYSLFNGTRERKPRPEGASSKWLVSKFDSNGQKLWQLSQPAPAADGADNAVTKISLHTYSPSSTPDLIAGGYMTDSRGAKRAVIQRISGFDGQIKWQKDQPITSSNSTLERFHRFLFRDQGYFLKQV